MRSASLALVVSLASPALAAFDNFPVKSINLNSAPSVSFYESPSVESSGLYDVHPVHGAVLSDGSYVMAGKAVEADGSSIKRMFCIKLTSTGSLSWVWGHTVDSKEDAANAVLQLPSGGDIIVVGYQTYPGSSVFIRTMVKLGLADGSLKWTWQLVSPTSSLSGAWEMASLTPDNSAVILAGVYECSDNSEFNFKSYGNVIAGKPVIAKIPVSALTGASAPADSAVSWSWGPTSSNHLTAKAARGLADGSVVGLLLGADASRQAALVKLTSTGTISWGPTDYAEYQGEGTDVVVSADGNSFVISGQGPGHSSETAGTSYVAGAYFGRLTKVSLTGTREWSKSYTSTPYDGSAGAYATLVKNECWGLQAVSDGYVVGCGTGIEDCNSMTGAKLTACQAGTPDTRTGAVARAASVWQSMIFKTNLAGELQWLRTDQYRGSDDVALGNAGWAAQSSASEYPIVTSDGGITSINDEVSGIGILRLGPSPPATNTASPPPPPPPAAAAATASPPPAAAAAATASPPPPTTATEEVTVTVTFTASGDVADYADGSTKANTIKSNLANTAGVATSAVTLKVTAASVNIEAKIVTASKDAAAKAKTAVAAEMGSAEAASSFLGVTVTETPTVAGGDTSSTLSNDPCFPSLATVTLADGTTKRMDAITEGDELVAATADGLPTTGKVSLLSIAKPNAEATFVTLVTSADLKLTLTPEHHLPVGEVCCSNLKKAKDVAVGDTVWAVNPAVVTAHTVTSKGLTIEKGLHSPVLANGAMPVVDGLATAFDSMEMVTLAAYALPYAIPLCKATGTCSLLRRAIGMYSGRVVEYIDGFEFGAEEATPANKKQAQGAGSFLGALACMAK